MACNLDELGWALIALPFHYASGIALSYGWMVLGAFQAVIFLYSVHIGR